MRLTPQQNGLHQLALKTVCDYKAAEIRLILILQEIDKTKLYRQFEVSS